MAMRMLSFLFCLTISIPALSQDQYSNEIEKIGIALHQQLIGKTIKKTLGVDSGYRVALVSIENEDGNETKLTQLLENEIAIDLVIKAGDLYNVLDRKNIEKLLAEKNIPKNYGDKRDFAKALGKVKAADIMVTGVVFNFDNQYKLIFTVLETKEGRSVGGCKGFLSASQLLKDKNDQTSISQPKNADNGGGILINSGYNDKPSDMDPDCVAKNTGNINVINKTSRTIVIYIIPTNEGRREGLTLGPNESDKIRGVKSDTYRYGVNASLNGLMEIDYRTGTIQVFKCKQAEITIR